MAWCKQDHILIKLKQETDMAASKRKQVVQDLEAATAELASATHELQSKQTAACSLDQKLADSECELGSLKQRVHALHTEQATAQRMHAQTQTQLAESQAQLDGSLLQLSSLRGQQHLAVSIGKKSSPGETSRMVTQTDRHTQEEDETAVAGHDDGEEQGAAISRSMAHDQECTPQVSLQLLIPCRDCVHILGFSQIVWPPIAYLLRDSCPMSTLCLLLNTSMQGYTSHNQVKSGCFGFTHLGQGYKGPSSRCCNCVINAQMTCLKLTVCLASEHLCRPI